MFPIAAASEFESVHSLTESWKKIINLNQIVALTCVTVNKSKLIELNVCSILDCKIDAF